MICHAQNSSMFNVSPPVSNCCSGLSGTCYAIAANTDLSGIGVRVAFYIQSVVNALLVILSPRESMASAWASTILTAALVIGAVVSKIQGNLTLHHATLILNFATLSCVSSLAVAPLLPVWRLRPDEYFAQEVRHAASMHDSSDDEGECLQMFIQSNRQKKRIKADQQRKRTILTLAILTQVVLQWTWGFVLFLSWSDYSQQGCNGSTVVLLFLARFTVQDINDNFFWVWPLWLLFSLGLTLSLTVVLALTSPELAQEIPSRSSVSSRASDRSQYSLIHQLLRDIWASVPRENRIGQFVLAVNIISLLLWVLFVFATETQRVDNCISSGENDFGGFGQITAALLALAPFWSLTIAIYKYPSQLRRRVKRFENLRRDANEDDGDTASSHSLPSPQDEDTLLRREPTMNRVIDGRAMRRGTSSFVLAVPGIPSQDMGRSEWLEMSRLSYSP
ncbi:hypothetical protein CERSUDRAFT_111785 [Gelatoporia subvermispora B]|uniref:Uncharacterized protein n=1 Tax=Ceriporiopsis subvermispora (strain B) TaxID=914234 RepID=M2R4K2_CERS8|nr:hypothetical protein CERSUDRAFT_111785 [Gelatoporia subvermispora B]